MSSTTFTPATLTRAFHAESIKAFSTRSMALGIVAAGTVTLATVAALAGLIPDGDLNPEWAAYGLLTTGMPILLVWAASVFFGEIGNGMLRATYLTVPGGVWYSSPRRPSRPWSASWPSCWCFP